MKKYWFLLALGVACGSSHQYDDDDDGSSGQAGTGGHAGKSGATSGSAGVANMSGGSANGTGGNVGVGGMNGTGGAKGGTGAMNGGGDANQGGSESGSSGESGASNGAEGGLPAAGGASATGGTAGLGGTSGGTAGIGGTAGLGGTSGGTAGHGGAGGSGGTAGHGGAGGSGGAHGGAGGQAATGGFIDNGGFGGVTNGSSFPLVELLVDGSSSMFEDGSWGQVFDSLVTDGVLAHFEGSLDLGLMIYQGGTAPSANESDPTCALLTNVGFAGDNGGEVGKTIADVGNAFTVGTKYETPTNFGMLSAINRLINVSVSPSIKKYIVLVVNGEPNTCLTKDPQCGQDASIAMVQEAHALGIRTLVVGLGKILGTTEDGCEPALARCHTDHLQDLANAGVGSPVEPPPQYSYVQACVQNNGGMVGSYASPGGGASARYYASTANDGLTGELNQAFQAIADGTVP